MTSKNEKVNQNTVAKTVNLKKNSISEFLKMSTLDEEIKHIDKSSLNPSDVERLKADFFDLMKMFN
jgi:hypothetical protein